MAEKNECVEPALYMTSTLVSSGSSPAVMKNEESGERGWIEIEMCEKVRRERSERREQECVKGHEQVWRDHSFKDTNYALQKQQYGRNAVA